MGFLGHLPDRAAKINVDNADLILARQPRSNLREGRRIVVPYLHGERPGFIRYPPQPIGMARLLLVEPDETPGIDHLGRQQPDTAEFADDLPKGKIGVARHRRLQDRRVDLKRTDPERRSDR